VWSSENLVRSSASTVIRKLSVASFASSFTKRSASSTQKNQPCENIAMETIKRRDIRSPMEFPLHDAVCLGEEAGRKAKRQRTAKEQATTVTTARSMKKVPGGVQRRGTRENAIPKPDLSSDIYTFPLRVASTSILLPIRSTSSRALTPLPDSIDNARKPSTEKIRNLGLWAKIGGGRNDGPGSFKKLLSIGRD
jgi:hypothetical protein